MTTAPVRRRARRGDGALLGREILEAAKALLAETGDENAVSIRAVSDRVGVSTPSIYLHYADKQALLDAVCADVFEQLDATLVAAAAEVADPFEALRAMGLAYVRFAVDNPEHYRILLMSRDDHSPQQRGTLHTDEVINNAAFQHLVEGVRACIDAGAFANEPEPTVLAMTLWASAHGIASLLIAKPHWPWPPLDEIVGSVISSAGLGLAAATRLPPHGELDPAGLRQRLDRLREV